VKTATKCARGMNRELLKYSYDIKYWYAALLYLMEILCLSTNRYGAPYECRVTGRDIV
jgi:hypothetical protein